MRKLTAADIIDFYNSRDDLLVLDAAGEYTHLDYTDIDTTTYDDGRVNAYDFCTTTDGDEVQILLERAAITDGDWFPDALDAGGNLTEAVAAEMADIITTEGIVPARARKAQAAEKQRQDAADAADAAAIKRAQAVAEVVAYLGGNQSAAARALGIDQSTVNRLMKKVTVKVGARVTVPAHAVPEDWPATGEAIEVGEETTVVELDNGRRQEIPSDEVTPA
jgi:hypothetical protein